MAGFTKEGEAILDKPAYNKKQEEVVKLVVDKGMTVEEAMAKVGYSETSIAHRTVLNSRAWPLLMDRYLSNSYLLDKHKSLLEKKETYRFFNRETNRVEIVRTDEIDAQAVAKGLDYAYKLKGKYQNETQINVGVQVNLGNDKEEFN